MVSAMDAMYTNFFNVNRHLLSFCFPSIKTKANFIHFFSINCQNQSLHYFFDKMVDRFLNRFGLSCADRNVSALMEANYNSLTDRCLAMNFYVLHCGPKTADVALYKTMV